VFVEEVVLHVEHEDESWHRVLSAFFGPRRAFANKHMLCKTKYNCTRGPFARSYQDQSNCPNDRSGRLNGVSSGDVRAVSMSGVTPVFPRDLIPDGTQGRRACTSGFSGLANPIHKIEVLTFEMMNPWLSPNEQHQESSSNKAG
jgi:hypothetical protein